MKKTLGVLLYVNSFLAGITVTMLTMQAVFRDGNLVAGLLGVVGANLCFMGGWVGLRLSAGRHWLTGEAK